MMLGYVSVIEHTIMYHFNTVGTTQLFTCACWYINEINNSRLRVCYIMCVDIACLAEVPK